MLQVHENMKIKNMIKYGNRSNSAKRNLKTPSKSKCKGSINNLGPRQLLAKSKSTEFLDPDMVNLKIMISDTAKHIENLSKKFQKPKLKVDNKSIDRESSE